MKSALVRNVLIDVAIMAIASVFIPVSWQVKTIGVIGGGATGLAIAVLGERKIKRNQQRMTEIDAEIVDVQAEIDLIDQFIELTNKD